MTSKPLMSGKTVDLEFKNITYKVNCWPDTFKIKQKTILNGVSGKFSPSQLCAIIGCSGSGKTSLLNILSGYKASGYTGTILANNKPQKLNSFKKQSCYIMQEDQLHERLTVREAMRFAVKLKFSVLTLDKSKQKMMDSILNNLNLHGSCDTLSANLSGGQRRKLSFALELIHDPRIMFFDEPTSGLDSGSAKQVLLTLKDFTESGRTIISTIHQASAVQLQTFDVLYVLSPSGQCVYHGLASALPGFLADHGLRCPAFHNIADYIIEVSVGEYGDQADRLTTSVDNGKSSRWMAMTDGKQLGLSVGDQKTSENLFALSNNNVAGRTFHNSTIAKAQKRQSFVQFITILHRSMIQTRREKFYITRLLINILHGAMYGYIYYGIGNDAAYVQDNLKLLFFTIVCVAFTSSSTMISSFPLEMRVLTKEHFNQWYSLPTFYMGYTIVDLPIEVSCTFLHCTIVYYFTGQPLEWSRFGYVTLMILMVGLMAQTAGMFYGTLFRDLRCATLLSMVTFMSWVIFAGVLIRIPDTPPSWRWLYDISFFKHALEGVLHSVYGSDRPDLQCSEVHCYSTSPTRVLKEVGMPVDKYWINILVISTIYLVLKLLVYQTVKRKLIVHW
ncbi:ATP-binding cassette sub-family G member 4-like [Adelges cooleyi]|uniref:ATP-binding cassette sub-family G member 4-like n=1 Tax=Adelges cooleyi TaxID=133065 RepID=UPI0021804227|nr:ATP-binding cassette sub-family G member 4-like [Adelges cooleyi]XP_050432201.1 ATP-binding cassette sub-family G member 4-like [Adelges cooleyi]XP_050432202.1 ATP-binding cassette sub-family G member 4-like [Adelges cooleyi]